jgi:hypothetical protein
MPCVWPKAPSSDSASKSLFASSGERDSVKTTPARYSSSSRSSVTSRIVEPDPPRDRCILTTWSSTKDKAPATLPG